MADVGAAVAHRRALEGPREGPHGRHAERADVARQVREPQRPGSSLRCWNRRPRSGQASSSCCSSGATPEETKSCGAPASSTVTMIPWRAPVRARTLSTTSASTGVEVERGTDPQDGRVEGRGALARCFELPPRVVGIGQRLLPSSVGTDTARCGGASAARRTVSGATYGGIMAKTYELHRERARQYTPILRNILYPSRHDCQYGRRGRLDDLDLDAERL